MKIAISGASGFLASHLIEKFLVLNDNELICLSSNCEEIEEKYARSNIKVYPKEGYKRIDWADVDVFINCAFPRSSNGVQMGQGLKYICNVLEYAIQHKVKSIINISSQSLYDQYRIEAANENSVIDLNSVYATGKYTVELLLDSICLNIPYSNVRLASLIGPGFNQRIVNKLIEKAIVDHHFILYGGNQVFSFMDVHDTVDAIHSMLEVNPKRWKKIYNLGTEEKYSLIDIADTICKRFKENYGVILSYTLNESDEKFNSSLTCDLFYHDFNWHPNYTLENSIDLIIKSFRGEK